MKKLHLVKVHFDRRTPAITQEWIERRLAFFRQYTKRSLEGQEFKNFGLWASCGVNMTWGEAMWIREETGADFVTCNPEHAPDEVLRNAAKGYDYVCVTRVDSDDLLAPDFLKLVDGFTPTEPLGTCPAEALMFRRGYLHDVRTGETGVYYGPSTPFHTMVIHGDMFRDPKRYAALDYGDHSKVGSSYKVTVMPDWKFTVLVHGGNFISDMSYGRERLFGVEKDWTVDRFLNPPVVFDVDDFCDHWDCLPELDRIKEQYPNFKCTLFTIPERTSHNLLRLAKAHDWIELAYHGTTHEPNEELKELSYRKLGSKLYSHLMGGLYCAFYVKGFRPPGWYIEPGHVEVLNDLGMWVALHQRDERKLGPRCQHGYYVVRDNGSHWHTSGEGQRAHSVCGNGIRECLPDILKKWPREQKFAFVSESILKIN